MFPCKLTLCLISLCTHPPLLMHLFSPFPFHLRHYLVCLPDNDCFSPLTDATFQNCTINVCNIRELCICIIGGCGYHLKKIFWLKNLFFPFSCDKHSNCLPGKSKKIKNCTIFSPPVCDGCEDGYYRDNQVKPNGGCVQCSPRCNILQVEIISCTTKHDRKLQGKRTYRNPDPR